MGQTKRALHSTSHQCVSSDEGNWGSSGSGGSSGPGVSFLGHRTGSAFGTGGYRSYSIWKLKSSFPGTWAGVCFCQAVFIPISKKKKFSFLLPSCRTPSTRPCSHLPIYPTGFQSGLGDEAPEVSVFCVKCHKILTYLILSSRPGTIFLAGNMAILYVCRSLQLEKE